MNKTLLWWLPAAIVTLLAALPCGAPRAEAQQRMVINRADGTKSVIPLLDIDSITFEDGPRLIFSDEFDLPDGSIPDPAKWQLCQRQTSAWNRKMSESYDQAYIQDGCLVLTGEKKAGEYLAGGIEMRHELGFKYGRVDVRARFEKMGQGDWPAIWMMPSVPLYQGWPDCGEVDIMEHLNSDANCWNVIHTAYTESGHKVQANPSIDPEAWHIYSIVWTEKTIAFYIDGNHTLTARKLSSVAPEEKQWPFDTKFYIILNNALGRTADETYYSWPGVIDDADLPFRFLVDYVRVTENTPAE